jgi:hypothetical protein
VATVVRALCDQWDITKGGLYEIDELRSDECRYFIKLDDVGDERTLDKVNFELVSIDAKSSQVGGNHYSKLAIQPYEYVTANGIPYIEGNVIKYVTRWKDKGGVEDLKKAIHSLEWLIEYTEKQDNA